MATWNHDDRGYHSENKMGNTHTALGHYTLASAFVFGAVPGRKNSPGREGGVPVAVGDGMNWLWCRGGEDGGWPLSGGRWGPPGRPLNECALNQMHIKEIWTMEFTVIAAIKVSKSLCNQCPQAAGP